jgi:hypothetical protein
MTASSAKAKPKTEEAWIEWLADAESEEATHFFATATRLMAGLLPRLPQPWVDITDDVREVSA